MLSQLLPHSRIQLLDVSYNNMGNNAGSQILCRDINSLYTSRTNERMRTRGMKVEDCIPLGYIVKIHRVYDHFYLLHLIKTLKST